LIDFEVNEPIVARHPESAKALKSAMQSIDPRLSK
jgi:hypothetical protein